MAFFTKIKGHHHSQGNVQVYNVRTPAGIYRESSHCVGATWISSVHSVNWLRALANRVAIADAMILNREPSQKAVGGHKSPPK